MKKLLFLLPLTLSGQVFAAAPKAMTLVRDELAKQGLDFRHPDKYSRQVVDGGPSSHTVIKRSWGNGTISLKKLKYLAGTVETTAEITTPRSGSTSISESLAGGVSTLTVRNHSSDGKVSSLTTYQAGKKVVESSWHQISPNLARSLTGDRTHYRYHPDRYLPRSLFIALSARAVAQDITVDLASGFYTTSRGSPPVTIKAGSTPKQIFEQLQAAGMAEVLEADPAHERSETWENPGINPALAAPLIR